MLVLLTIVASAGALCALVYYLFFVSDISPVSRAIYFTLFLLLFYCALAYQVNRYGAALRHAKHVPLPPETYDYLLAPDAPTVTVLIPSYREERRVLRMTILSAALARYGQRRLVVLLDDPPLSDTATESRATIAETADLLDEPMAALRAERADWQLREAGGRVDVTDEAGRLASLHEGLARWLEALAQRFEAEVSAEFAHVDRFFLDRVVLELARHHRAEAGRLAAAALDPVAIGIAYERLARSFCAQIECFERKRFENLSHAPNKAMNLNSYIALMGGRYDVVEANGRQYIAGSEATTATLEVPASKYVLTLDADSVILPSYMLELTHIIEHDEGVGVVQTPYLTFPHSVSPVERVAGATTDIQFLVHQGSSHFDAAYWVGANALIRLAALDVIRTVQEDGGKEVDVFIQDATVIEDTGSTIDLLGAGWRVYNHYAGLAYSATPADFGSLAIQRQRWSKGGIIIFPTLVRQYLGNSGRARRLVEFVLRSHYLLSPLLGNTAVFLLMVFATIDARHIVLAPLAIVPYFLLYGLDLSRSGYRFRDLFAVCALNLMLLPVGFAGIFASLWQMVTGRKGAFSRTPKIAGRTSVRPFFILFNLAMLGLMARYVIEGALAGDVLASAVPATNLAFYAYGLVRFVGLRNGLMDVSVGLFSPFGRLFGAGLRAPLAATGRFVGHPASRVTAGVTALLMGLMPVSFGSADAARMVPGLKAGSLTAPVPDAAPAVADARLSGVAEPAAGPVAETLIAPAWLRPGLALKTGATPVRGNLTTRDD